MIVAGWLVGCAPELGPSLEHQLEEGDRQAAAQFGAALVSAEPPGVVCSTHVTWLVHLVATTDDPTVAGAAMESLASCAENWHAPDVRVATARWWDAKGLAVPRGLVAVAEPFVVDAESTDPMVQGLGHLATSHAAIEVRLAALELLDRRTWGKEPDTAAAFVDALLAVRQPVLTATVLHWLRFEAPNVHFRVRPRLQAATTLLLRDIDPGVRGRAALVLARLAPGDDSVIEQIRQRLRDPHPFTRAAAAKALADLGSETFVHDLVPLLNDHESTVWHSRPFDRLDGSSDRIRFLASPHERVDEAVLVALERLTSNLASPFEIRPIDPAYAALDILSATRDARAWYQAAYVENDDPETDEEGG